MNHNNDEPKRIKLSTEVDTTSSTNSSGLPSSFLKISLNTKADFKKRIDTTWYESIDREDTEKYGLLLESIEQIDIVSIAIILSRELDISDERLLYNAKNTDSSLEKIIRIGPQEGHEELLMAGLLLHDVRRINGKIRNELLGSLVNDNPCLLGLLISHHGVFCDNFISLKKLLKKKNKIIPKNTLIQ